MTAQEKIASKLATALQPTHLDVINESHKHNVPAGSESHFKLVIVSEKFSGLMTLARHRLVNEILADELKNHVHALSMSTLTPEEWQKRGQVAHQTPPCLGGSKHDK